MEKPTICSRLLADHTFSPPLTRHPQREGDEEGGQGGAGRYSQTHQGEKSQQRRQDDVSLVSYERLQPLAELEDGKDKFC